MYKAAARWMIRRAVNHMNNGDYCLALAMFADDAVLSFPGDNTWANQHRPTRLGRDAFATHRGKGEIEAFMQRYVQHGLHMVVDDILVNGPPWNTRAAARVHHWAQGPDGTDDYTNRAVLFVTTRWGKIRSQEDYEDTERVAAYDRFLAERLPAFGEKTRKGTAMTTKGFDHLYVETHNWGKAVAFWQRLGFALDFDTGHGSGMLSHPAGGPTVFLAEQSIEDPLATEVYLGASTDYVAPEGVEVVSAFRDTHWGTKVMVIQDPDGHRFRIQAPVD